MKKENKFVCTDCFKFNKCVESSVSWIFFAIGLIATVAIRAVNVVLDYSASWAKVSWYIGVAGFFIFFLYKFKHDQSTQKELKNTGLVEKILAKEGLNDYEYQVLGSILCKLKSKKEKINYFFIFFFSGVALLAAVYIDFIK
ncbi:MAG: hypothetical protein HOA57_01655 [Candidatus Magasanikbacteria bacterium]|jgi:hypothetical protein|nr:hypothetical protein [Candidatus Magasanikbacteria bacterium]MBT4315106.1 hypothetical protein [Candidatus Magasanikbacteria bacterium]MBT4547016.1 hypothetical protein [Candidatus Magasanikbacteria bacterium]MBT6819060.1 hypothetical protein [Candidatus Magasanikbacteria bacterium]